MESIELTCFCQQYKTAIILFLKNCLFVCFAWGRFVCFPTNNSPNYVNSIITIITVRL